MLTPEPPRTVELVGSPGERGRQHGELLAREIRLMRRALLNYLARLSFYLGAFPVMSVLQFLARLSFWPHIPARLKEEFKGLASGASLGLPLVLLINTLDDLANNMASCSALAVGEDRTTQGRYLVGRNLDYPVFVDVLVNLQTLFLITPDQGVPLVSLAWPGYVGVLTGMNRARVALAQLTAMCRDTTLKGVPAGLRHRLALEQETTVQDVAARILEPPRTIGNNLLLCGPQEALVLEISAHRHGIRRPTGGVIAATNHFQSNDMWPVKGEFRRRPPFAVLSPYHFTEAYSQDRTTRLHELAANRTLEPEDLQAILGDPGIANPGTVNSAVFAPAELTLWVAVKQTPPVSQGKFAKVKLWEAGP